MRYRLFRFPKWIAPKFNPKTPLTGLSLRLLAIGAIKGA